MKKDHRFPNELVYKKQRGERGGWDYYYTTAYPRVFLHEFRSIDAKQYISAEKLLGDYWVLHRVNRFTLPLLGGIPSLQGVSRDGFTEANEDAHHIHRKRKPSKSVDKTRYSNRELYQKLTELFYF